MTYYGHVRSSCKTCGDMLLKTDMYPNKRTTRRPKPKLKERYKYCYKCYNKTLDLGGNNRIKRINRINRNKETT